jgi:hypothetical protein
MAGQDDMRAGIAADRKAASGNPDHLGIIARPHGVSLGLSSRPGRWPPSKLPVGCTLGAMWLPNSVPRASQPSLL